MPLLLGITGGGSILILLVAVIMWCRCQPKKAVAAKEAEEMTPTPIDSAATTFTPRREPGPGADVVPRIPLRPFAMLRDSEESEVFWFVEADWLRARPPGLSMPHHQLLLQQHPEALVQRPIRFSDVLSGRLVKEGYGAVSHRWMRPDRPDPDNTQLREVCAWLEEDRSIRYVWLEYGRSAARTLHRMRSAARTLPRMSARHRIPVTPVVQSDPSPATAGGLCLSCTALASPVPSRSEWCMPQFDRTEDEQLSFRRMLSHVNLLYLGMKVLILLDVSYISRFWTQFEGWLSMQMVTAQGLKSAVGSNAVRHTIRCIYNAVQGIDDLRLIEMWATKTPLEAFTVLSRPDVSVTNQSDKDSQLPKIHEIDSQVQNGFIALKSAAEQKASIWSEVQSKEALSEAQHVESRAWLRCIDLADQHGVSTLAIDRRYAKDGDLTRAPSHFVLPVRQLPKTAPPPTSHADVVDEVADDPDCWSAFLGKRVKNTRTGANVPVQV